MNSARKTQSFSILTQGGVALADILANSVAVILILIIITLSVQQQKAEEELEKNKDITTILTRQIATSVVYNDLPSSPPARLHDYHSCAIPHDCQPHLYPIVEMHEKHIRIFNTNTKIYRNELLRADNAFDRYLRTLNQDQRLNIRLDVYSVSEYYLTLGILQDNKIAPRHWHYLGEDAQPLKNDLLKNETIAGVEAEENVENHANAGKNFENGHSDSNKDTGDATSQGNQEQQPQQLAGAESANVEMLEALRYDELLPPSEGAANETQPEQNTNGFGTKESEPERKQPSTLFEALVGAMAESRGIDGSDLVGGASNSNGKRSLKLHIPNSDQQQTSDSKQGGEESITLPAEKYNRVILTYIFTVLNLAEREQTLAIPGVESLLFNIVKSQDALHEFENYDLVEKLAKMYDKGVSAKHPKLSEIKSPLQKNNNTYFIEGNRPLPKNALHIHQPSPWLANLENAKSVQPAMLMRLYPSLYKGEFLEFPKGYALIVHPEQLQDTQLKWLPVAVLDHRLEDISMGFIYASVNGGSLLIEAGPNQLTLNKYPVSNPNLSAQDHRLQIIPFMWLFILVALLLFLQRYRKRALKLS